MRNRFTGAVMATVMAAAVTLTLTAQQQGRQGGAVPAPAPAAPAQGRGAAAAQGRGAAPAAGVPARPGGDRIAGRPNLNGIYQAINTANWNLEDHSASTRLNSSHSQISYAVFCLKKKKTNKNHIHETKQNL